MPMKDRRKYLRWIEIVHEHVITVAHELGINAIYAKSEEWARKTQRDHFLISRDFKAGRSPSTFIQTLKNKGYSIEGGMGPITTVDYIIISKRFISQLDQKYDKGALLPRTMELIKRLMRKGVDWQKDPRIIVSILAMENPTEISLSGRISEDGLNFNYAMPYENKPNRWRKVQDKYSMEWEYVPTAQAGPSIPASEVSGGKTDAAMSSSHSQSTTEGERSGSLPSGNVTINYTDNQSLIDDIIVEWTYGIKRRFEREVLKSALDPRKDVTMFYVGPPEDPQAILISGKVNTKGRSFWRLYFVESNSDHRGYGKALVRAFVQRYNDHELRVYLTNLSDQWVNFIKGLGFDPEKKGSSLYIRHVRDHAQMSDRRGGIDLTSDKALSVQNNGQGIKFHIDSAQRAQLQDASGFVPVIINIQPMTDLRQFLEDPAL